MESNLDKIELRDYYEKVVTLLEYKKELLQEYYDTTDNEHNLYVLDYLLTNKLVNIKKV